MTSDTPRWNLSPLYADPAALDRDLDATLRLADAFAASWQGRVASLAPADLLRCLTEYEALLAGVWLPGGYAGLRTATDSLDEAVKALAGRIEERTTEALNRTRFFDLELSAAPESAHAAWLASDALKTYRHYLERSRAYAPHNLARDVENALATKDLTGRRAWTQLYNELTAAWTFPFTVDGETRDRSLAELRSLREHPDRDVRRRAVAAILERFQRDARTFAFVVNTVYQDHRSENELRGYTAPEAPTLLGDELSMATLDALMTAVEEHYPVAQRYWRLKARALGLDTLETADLLAPYPKADRELTWSDARAEVLRAFAQLDPSVAASAQAFFDGDRIDAVARPGKRDGAFCASLVPGRPPYVLMNFHGRLRDAFTLAHELGHGVHFDLAGQRQTLLNYWPTTPMAETASVFGEMVLARNLLAVEKDPAVRRQLIASRIEEALGTVHRQVCFTRYERNAHARRAEGVIPAQTFADLWAAEHKKLYGDAVQWSAQDVHGWPAISHLIHYRFYCYSYAFGQLLVFALYRQWERDPEGFVPRYLALLSEGGRDTPTAMLARVGVDVTAPAFWRDGLDVITRMVDDFERELG